MPDALSVPISRPRAVTEPCSTLPTCVESTTLTVVSDHRFLASEVRNARALAWLSSTTAFADRKSWTIVRGSSFGAGVMTGEDVERATVSGLTTCGDEDFGTPVQAASSRAAAVSTGISRQEVI